MHDLPYWFRFFALTRGERIAQAQGVAQVCGLAVHVASERGAAISEYVPHFVEALRPAFKDPPARYWHSGARVDEHLAQLERATRL